MAESTLAITYADLRQAVAHFLGLSLTSTDWSTDEATLIEMIVKSGLRKFYKPQLVFQGMPPHRWSFLNPTTTLTTIASYVTGTIALTDDDATVTLTGGVWPSWAAANGSLVVDSVTYAIASRTSDTVIELSADWSGGDETEASYELRHDGMYDLPDNFAGMASRVLSHAHGEMKPSVRLVSEAQIRGMWAKGHTGRHYPLYFAVRPKNTTVSATAGQRFELMFYPIPDAAYVLSYEMVHQLDMISATYAYPLGGAAHGETIKAACLAAAELMENDIADGPRESNYLKLLASSIREDQVAYQAEFLGYNGDNSDHSHGLPEVRRLAGLVSYEPSE